MIIDESAEHTELLEQALSEAGYEIAETLSMPERLVESVERIMPDVIIIDMVSPDQRVLDQMRILSKRLPRPVVMFASRGDSETIAAAVSAGVHAYVVDGFDVRRLCPILDVAVARFNDYQSLRDELEKTKSTLQERKVLERAKGLLMEQKGMNESEAHQALRKLAMDQGKKMGEVARSVISVMELLN